MRTSDRIDRGRPTIIRNASRLHCLLSLAILAAVFRLAAHLGSAHWRSSRSSRLPLQSSPQLSKANSSRLLSRSASQQCRMPTEAPVGRWVSPITTTDIVQGSLRLGSPTLLQDGRMLWIEGRPTEAGRSVLVLHNPATNTTRDITPAPDTGFNVRTTVHEYGGGESLVTSSAVYFSNFKDQQVWVQDLEGAAPKRLTSEGSQRRFADYVADPARPRLLAVCEDHSTAGQEAVNSLVSIDLTSGEVSQLAAGRDFYQSPAISPDGSRLAWVQWDHPNMPWDDTQLVVAEVAPDGSLSSALKKVAGGADESVQQPQWGPDGKLYFVSDRTGWWNLYTWDPTTGQVAALLPKEAEFGVPMWVFGAHTYCLLEGGTYILTQYNDPTSAGTGLAVIDTGAATLTPLSTGYSLLGRIRVVEGSGGQLSMLTTAASSTKSSAVVLLEVEGGVQGLLASGPDNWKVIKSSSSVEVDPGYLTEPQSIQFPTEGGLTAWMYYYPPRNQDYVLPPGEKPPLIVKIHGGPTSAAATMLSLSYQYYTSRGFAIADVNYGGSTGYGRAYRNRLKGNWGVVDVDDVCNAAKHLAAQGLVDPQRLCIDGGSAGGYTTLAALAFRQVFSAGASYFGVADAGLLAKHTHKFESRYLDGLIGPWPEAEELYKQRSPLYAADNISAAVALFQGDEDKVVPPEQSVQMYEAVKAKGIPTTLMMYQGEQHGFRKAETQRSVLEGELYFYSQVLGFHGEYSPELQPMVIDNLPVAPTPAGPAA